METLHALGSTWSFTSPKWLYFSFNFHSLCPTHSVPFPSFLLPLLHSHLSPPPSTPPSPTLFPSPPISPPLPFPLLFSSFPSHPPFLSSLLFPPPPSPQHLQNLLFQRPSRSSPQLHELLHKNVRSFRLPCPTLPRHHAALVPTFLHHCLVGGASHGKDMGRQLATSG